MSKLKDEIKKAIINNKYSSKKTLTSMIKDYADENNIEINLKDVENYMKATGEKEYKKVYNERYNRKFVFNYRGAWFFDIGFNRRDKKLRLDTNHYLGQWGIFLNANSGWVQVYDLKSKSSKHLMKCIDKFKQACDSNLAITLSQSRQKNIKYPCKKIITDGEAGVVAGEHDGTIIEKHDVKNEGHRVMGRIDAFMSELRLYAFRTMESKGDYTKQIPKSILDAFVDEWNLKYIDGVKCSRASMMCDPRLEEAYICAALYGNQDTNEGMKASFPEGTEVKFKKIDREVFGNAQAKGLNEEPGTYLIHYENGKAIGVDTKNPNHKVNFRPNQIKSTIYTNDFYNKQLQLLKDVEDPINIQPVQHPRNIHQVETDVEDDDMIPVNDPDDLNEVAQGYNAADREAQFNRLEPPDLNIGHMIDKDEKTAEKIKLAAKEAKRPGFAPSTHRMPTRSMDKKEKELTPQDEALVDEVVKYYKDGEKAKKQTNRAVAKRVAIAATKAKVSPVRTQDIQVDDGKLKKQKEYNEPDAFATLRRTVAMSRHEEREEKERLKREQELKKPNKKKESTRRTKRNKRR